MFLTEPRQTPYDLHFHLLNIPVRIHPMFWLVSALMGFAADRTPQMVLLWIVAVFISILVHEMGHAIVIRYFGWEPSVVLYSFGGLAIHNPYVQSQYGPGRARRSKWTQIIISAAGPAAGFLLAGLMLAFLAGTRVASVELEWFEGTNIPRWYKLGPSMGLMSKPNVFFFILDMLFINIWWGLINLLPIWPLDGGKISRELFQMVDGGQAIRNSLMLSLICAIAVAIWAFQAEQRFMPIFFGFMAIQNYQELSGSNRYGGNNPW
ncbi:site-2 protease family protein [Bremerella sp. JC817]|uniref:site-2 protease family protein n=1 Tax=Bremerella sp. JC817 TaxID=3231756 RepID=UPI00345B49BA